MTRQRRRNMTYVDVYLTGPKDGPARIFTERSSAMFELYMLQLRAGDPIKATTSWTRVFVSDKPREPGEGPWIHEDEPSDGFGFSDAVFCLPDHRILQAPRADWPRLYLDWLHQHLLALAEVRQWDSEPLHAARQGCLDAGLRLQVTSKPKLSPTRRHKSHLDLTIDEDGTRHLTMTVSSRGGELVASTVRQFQPFSCSVQDFRTITRQMRWEADDHVVADNRWRVGDLPWQPGFLTIDLLVPEMP